MEGKEKACTFSKLKSPGKEVGIFLVSSVFNNKTKYISHRSITFFFSICVSSMEFALDSLEVI